VGRLQHALSEELLHIQLSYQVEEALEGYQRLQVAAAAVSAIFYSIFCFGRLTWAVQEYHENVLQLALNRRDGIGRLAAALKHRIQVWSFTRSSRTRNSQGVGCILC
jgi:hypothetical protein